MRPGKEWKFKSLSILLGFVFGIILGEAIVRITNIDIEFLKHTIFYHPVDQSVHRIDDSNVLFSPKPSAAAEFETHLHPKEKKYKKRRVTINKFGYRSPEWTKEKPPGLFRIFIFGGSNTFGASVSDEDTYPQKLNALLSEYAPGKFEVWNGGLNAGVLSQSVFLAKRAVEGFSPDLIIIQSFGNFGRRGFLGSVDEFDNMELPRLFAENPELFAENVPSFIFDNSNFVRVHDWLVQRVALYRFANILWNNSMIQLNYPNHHKEGCVKGQDCDRISKKYSEFGEKVSAREFNIFQTKNSHIPMVFFDPYSGTFCTDRPPFHKGLPSFSLCPEGKPSEYREPHPPSYVYDFYASEILKYLVRHRYIKLPQKRNRRLTALSKLRNITVTNFRHSSIGAARSLAA